MTPKQFIAYYKQAFGENVELPLGFWYSEESVAEPIEHKGCFISVFNTIVQEGTTFSGKSEDISCPGGRLWSGFVPQRSNLAHFVSMTERFKKDEALAAEFLDGFPREEQAGKYINVARIDKIETFDNLEGLIFFATPDILSGLVSWCLFDTNEPDAVSVPFGSGCSSIITQVLMENKNHTKRTFIGMFDPCARLCVEENILTYAVPINRFKEMCETLVDTCLINTTKDWQKVKDRIEGKKP
ncbi:DUF169 domain-containing protein [Bacteroidales bacterium OttesenSCG-928-K03]|nr:DUF169 domain-containing protein [Odoribacter sp. OttesenSCG-928-L07]MDL2239642.1 DUF169 domain-containing protein [Bacteroidales bacterium OttesenSCG-928-L14]MDL2242528.1 DUF169 domain-containing protein [Bacteroidales bacterium OttesenSCG-928-K03]